jgi:hypothetical protein
MSIRQLKLSEQDKQESIRNLRAFMEVSRKIKARGKDEHQVRSEPVRHNTNQQV